MSGGIIVPERFLIENRPRPTIIWLWRTLNGGALTTIRPMTVMPNYRCLFGLLISFGVVLFAGCDLWDKMMGKKEAESEVRRPVISVETMRPLRRDVVDYEEFTGDTNAVNDVTLQAQVSGILTKCDFAEGAFVKKDDVLFEIEPEVYKAALDTAVGNLESVSFGLNSTEISNLSSPTRYRSPTMTRRRPLTTNVWRRLQRPKPTFSRRPPRRSRRRSI